MIVTLTANPSHDRTVTLDGPLDRGKVIRAASVTSVAGGKGVNISRAAVNAGLPSVAVLPCEKDDPFVHELLAAGIDARPVPGSEPRVNITITEPDGTTTKLNSPGSELSQKAMAEIEDSLRRRAGSADWVVMAGSLPPGAPVEWYSHLVGVLRKTVAKVAVDTSDAPLKALVDGLDVAPPHLMKPNGHELASFLGGDGDAMEADPVLAARAAHQLVERGVETVLVTLGGNGAVLVSAEGAWYAAPPPTTVVSTVGAGDSSLFGYLLGDVRAKSPAQRLALAVAYGSAAAGLPGTTIPRPSQVDADLVTPRELDITQGG